MKETLQFGEKPGEKYTERPCAYALVFNGRGQMLTVWSRGVYHLVGGGINDHENPEQAVIREAREETGYDIRVLEFIGKANQFFPQTDIGPLNKVAVFYKAEVVRGDLAVVTETSQEVCWIIPEEFLTSPASEFQKWAVRSVCSRMREGLVA